MLRFLPGGKYSCWKAESSRGTSNICCSTKAFSPPRNPPPDVKDELDKPLSKPDEPNVLPPAPLEPDELPPKPLEPDEPPLEPAPLPKEPADPNSSCPRTSRVSEPARNAPDPDPEPEPPNPDPEPEENEEDAPPVDAPKLLAKLAGELYPGPPSWKDSAGVSE